MSRKSETESVPYDTDQGIAIFGELDTPDYADEEIIHKETRYERKAARPQVDRRGEYSPFKTGVAMLGAVAVMGALGIGVGAVGYAINSSHAFAFHKKTVASLEAGKGNVLDINTLVGPIRIGGFVTKATTEATVGKELVGPFGIDIHYANQSILRQDRYETNFVINPDDIEIAFNQGDPYTTKDDKMTLTIKDGAIGTETRLAPKNGAETIDSKSDISAIPAASQKIIADAVAEKMGTYASKVPALGDGAKKTITLQARMEQVADAYLGVQVDKKCTEKVASIDSFQSGIEKNFRVAVRTKLLDPTTYEGTTNNDLIALEHKDVLQMTALTDHATVVLEKDYAKNIVPDKEQADALASFQHDSGIETTIQGNKEGETGFACGVTEKAKMQLVDANGNIVKDEVAKKSNDGTKQ